MKHKQNQALVVTTIHRGVFFGYGINDGNKTITLRRARMCVYWNSELHGVCGLAVTGPVKQCKIGPAVPVMTLQDVTAVMECSTEAAASWEKEIWT